MLIKGYQPGSNITLLNAFYQYPRKDEMGKTIDDYMCLIYKDLDTKMKSHQIIYKPDYEFYKLKDGYVPDYNLFFIENNKANKITTRYRDLLKTIATETGNEEYFYGNIDAGNYRANNRLHTLTNIMSSDMDIEDHYRFRFDKEYENNICQISKAYFDIEVDTMPINGEFPELGQCPVNAISCILEDKNTVCVFLLRDDGNKLIQEFEDNINKNLFKELQDFIIDAVGGEKQAKKYKVDNLNIEFRFFDEEIKLIEDFFKFININEPDFLLAWNMSFDIPYLYQRIIKLGYDPLDIICHPNFEEKVCKIYIDERHHNEFAERCDKYTVSMYTVLLDQMIQFASRRKGQDAFKSFKLDDIGYEVAGVRKLDYSHITRKLAMLPYLNYKIFVFYNIMDTIVQKCIEAKTGDIDYIFGKCVVNNTRYDKGHRQTVYLTNRGAKEFYKNKYIIGNNVNRDNPSVSFTGALVGKPENNSDYSKLKQNNEVLNIMNNMVDFDYKSLYPSIDRENNMAPNTQVGKLTIENQIYKYENPFHYDSYSRGGSFAMDFVNGNYLEFGKRWFHLASIREFMEDCHEYFTMVQIPFIAPNRVVDGCIEVIDHYPNIETCNISPIYHDYENNYSPIIRYSQDINIKEYVRKVGGD